jgi:quinol monooxygenase YgiN
VGTAAARAARTKESDMPALDVVAVLTAKTGSEQLVGDALAALVEPTRGEEGNISYHLFASGADPAVFITIEKWRSQDDLDAHMQTDHIKQTLAVAGEHLAQAPAVHPLAPLS